MAETDHDQEDHSLINLAALYATLILIIGTVVSEWPPDGQEVWFPPTVNDAIFVISAIATILIGIRILCLIRNADPWFGAN